MLYLIVAITALATIGVNVASLITAVGAAALTAGLALQDSLSNLASGMIILFNKPFVAGDILEFEGLKGRVTSIKIFFTTIHTLDNKIVTIPNSRLTTNNVVNCTMVDRRRVDLTYTVFNQVAQQVQLARAKVQQETPVYTVMQPAVMSVRASSPKKMVILFGFVFLAFFGTAAWVIFKDKLQEWRTSKE